MQNQIAAAALPGLKQLELSSASVRTQLDTLGQGITNGISNPLVDIASGATRAGDAFKQMGLNVIRSIEQMIVNMTIAVPIARGLQSILGGFLPGSGIGQFGQQTMLGDATFLKNANGNVFAGSGISAFSNTVVDRPTIFPFAKGIGLMGEAGAEAIMPLTRIGGKLGVRADGAKSGDTYIDMSGMQISLPEDPNGNDPTGATRASSVAKALEGTVRGMVRSELIKQQRPGGDLNRASAI
jgi:lambda family phage tail tape measure protein